MGGRNDGIVILGAARTPVGGLMGALSTVPAPQLGAIAVGAALERSNVPARDLDEVIMGCVLPAGMGQAPARQAAVGAGVPAAVPATTVNKMCGSGMRAVMFGMDLIAGGAAGVVAAGGMESMSNAPYLVPGARSGLRLGHGRLLDHMYVDGLEDSFGSGWLMGAYAEQTARKYGFTRAQQDEYAITSLTRAQAATRDGKFRQELAAVTVRTRQGELLVEFDEQPQRASVEKIPKLKPAFAADGTVTAANSSSISDGAAALILASGNVAARHGWAPQAALLAHAAHAQEPEWFTTAPVSAIRKVLAKVGWKPQDVDLYEINEAFAVVVMAAMRDLALPHERVNIHGGACAIGHPVGASGARILVTLLNALRDRGMKRGIAAICIGGGEATAIALEVM